MGEVAAPHTISIEDGYARFVPAGFVTHMMFVHELEQAMIECQQHGQTRLLADVRALEHPPLSGIDRYELSAAAAEMWDRSILLAVLARPDQMAPDRFGQAVARNRGLFYEPFTEEPPALEWLRRPRGSKNA